MIQRIALLLRERFPVLPSLVGAALLATCADVVGTRLLGRHSHLDGVSVAMAIVVFCLFFVVRGVDELRDLPGDRLAHPERPLPRGAITPRDVVVAVVVAALAAIGAGLMVGGPGGGCAVAAVLLLTVLLQLDVGLRFIARRPLLTLVVHQSMVPLWVLLVMVVRHLDDVSTVDDTTLFTALSPALSPSLWPALALATGLSLLFELGRKVHHPDDENPLDDSYSSRWGPRAAAAVVAVVALAIGGVVWVVTSTLSLPVWSALVPGVALVWVVGSCAVFVVAPRRGGGRPIALSTALASLWVYLPLVVGAV